MKQMRDSGLGVSALRLAVALSACTPRSFLAVGYPLQSLTRNALALFVACCSSLISTGQFFKPDRFMPQELMHANGIKCITVYSERDSGNVRNQELCFDKDTRLLQVLTFWGNPVQADTERYVYNSDGRELQYSSTRSVADGFSPQGDPLMKWVTVRYGSHYEHGRLVRYAGDDGAYLMTGSHYTVIRYDTLGRVIERVYHDTLDHEIERTAFIYDKNGRQILYLHYDAHDQITAFEVSTYDERGRLTNSELRNASKYSDYRTDTRYYYDPAGKLLKEERLDDSRQEPIVYEYRYDPSGLLTRIVSNIGNQSIGYTYY